jgi:RNA recognition motif-containing protein
MTKRCEICKFDLQDDYSYQGHLQGKKHIKNVERLEFLQSLIQRSIFVSRIPWYISPENLIKFFSQFDEVLKYRFGPNYVIIEFKTTYVS